jgi:hypothetical protein
MTPFSSSSTPDAPRRAIWATLAAFFLALAVESNGGRYSSLGMIYLSFAIASAIGAVFFPVWWPNSRRALNIALVAATTFFAALWLHPDDADSPFLSFVAYLVACALVAAMVARLSRFPLFGRALFPLLLVAHAALGISTIVGARHFEQTSPRLRYQVRNDVQIFAQEGARLLSEGKNPYSVRMPNVMGADLPFYAAGATDKDGKLPFGYPYLPLSLFFSLPGYWLGDFRFAHVLALVGTAWFLAYARPSSTSQLAATLFLLFPPTTFVLLMSWIEPVTLFCLGATLWCYFRAPRWLFLALGCLLASKQYTVFLLALLPLLISEKERWRPLLLQSVGVALAICLPMALWDWGGFYRSVIEIQFKQPFRTDSLSYLVTFFDATGQQLSPLFGFAALLFGLGLGLRFAPRTATLWCSAGALAYLGFFAFNKQAFANYYFWPFGLLAAAVAIALPANFQGVESLETPTPAALES